MSMLFQKECPSGCVILDRFEILCRFVDLIGRNVFLRHQTIGESTEVSIGHSSYHCSETSLQSSILPNTDVQHDSCHL